MFPHDGRVAPLRAGAGQATGIQIAVAGAVGSFERLPATMPPREYATAVETAARWFERERALTASWAA